MFELAWDAGLDEAQLSAATHGNGPLVVLAGAGTGKTRTLVSRVASLLDRGVAHCAKKFGEEAFETALAAVGEDRERLIAEAADLVYHLLVLLKAREVTLAEVEAALGARTRQSGLDEKAARQRG